MKILIFSASTREGSINSQLTKAMGKKFKKAGFTVKQISLADYDMPIYNGDWDAANGAPKAAKDLAKLMAKQDAVFFSSPEYNGGLPALLKNTIDWLTRVGSMDHYHKPVFAIGSCTPGPMSGIMVMRQIQFILNRLGAELVPVQLGVGNASDAFKTDGSFARAANDQMADKLIAAITARLSRRA